MLKKIKQYKKIKNTIKELKEDIDYYEKLLLVDDCFKYYIYINNRRMYEEAIEYQNQNRIRLKDNGKHISPFKKRWKNQDNEKEGRLINNNGKIIFK
mgnify:CR=1 FL=1|tara:strand:- start:138 stop:428 length:291 start_codon:yes stop_codon:yes gene_type:complete